ncbi:MAG: hypothetical protein ACT4PT_10940, partial [Methanobacteriota archaeon]
MEPRKSWIVLLALFALLLPAASVAAQEDGGAEGAGEEAVEEPQETAAAPEHEGSVVVDPDVVVLGSDAWEEPTELRIPNMEEDDKNALQDQLQGGASTYNQNSPTSGFVPIEATDQAAAVTAPPTSAGVAQVGGGVQYFP